MQKFIQIRSSKFPPSHEENLELPNGESFIGEFLSEYLATKLKERGYIVPCVCLEDWGWWIELGGAPFPFGVCVYCTDAGDGTENAAMEYVCSDSLQSKRMWSWKKFRYVDTTTWGEKLHQDLIAIFNVDPRIELIRITDKFP